LAVSRLSNNSQLSILNCKKILNCGKAASILNSQLAKHELRFLSLFCMFLYEIWEEKQFEDNEDDEQLYQYDGPQRAPERHAAEPIIV